MSETPQPSAPAVRFRVVAGSDVVKRSKSPASNSNSPSIIPPPQRIRYVRPIERLVYARPPPGYHGQRYEMPFSQPINPSQPRRSTIIRQPIARIIRPINPQQQHTQSTTSTFLDNKKKLITILKSFLNRCSTMPEANMSQMILTTEQYLKGVVTTTDYMQVLHQNIKGVRENLASFLELYIYAVRKDIYEKKISLEEVLPYQLIKKEASQNSPSFQIQQQPTTTYSTPSPSATVSYDQQPNIIKHEPMSVSSNHQQEQQVSSPIITSNNSMQYQTVKMEAGSSRSSPILRTTSPQYQIIHKSHGSVGMIEHQQRRESPLTISREMQQPKTSPLAATTAPNMEMQTPMSFVQEQPQIESIESQQPLSQESYITPEQSLQFQPQPQTSQPQPSEQPQEEKIDADTPLTELPHEIALQRSLIDPATFSALMQRKVPGITIESPAFLMISEFLETKIKKLISNARLAAEHRSEQFRSNPNYVEAENPKAQLKALEKLEKAEKKRKLDLENERLSKNTKNDSSKVKEIAKTADDENLNRDANEAAMSALGGKKRTWQSRKVDDNGGPAAKKAALARAKQISMKDLLFAFEKDSFAKDSIIYRKVLYGLYSDSKN